MGSEHRPDTCAPGRPAARHQRSDRQLPGPRRRQRHPAPVDRENAAVIAEIHDDGHLSDPLTGRHRPRLASTDGGRGLWMIHQLCDLVEIRATEGGLTLRLHMTP
nr:ATP-binding protein [Streptomyces sp. CBMA123]